MREQLIVLAVVARMLAGRQYNARQDDETRRAFDASCEMVRAVGDYEEIMYSRAYWPARQRALKLMETL